VEIVRALRKRYLTSNPDVAREGVSPLIHYLKNGVAEGRAPVDRRERHRGIRIAVVLHLFYDDLWEEIASFLRNIPIAFDLFVSVPRENLAAMQAQIHRSYPGARIFGVRNVGRDVAPFLIVLPLVLSGHYTAVCKVHSKKGPIEPDTWRRLLLQGLLGSKHLVSKILNAFQSYPDLSLVGPRDLYVSGPALMVEDRPKVETLSLRLYPGCQLLAEWGFFAGTMFWARTDFLAKLSLAVRDEVPFEHDNTRIGGQYAHAFERIFGLMATMDRTRIGLTHCSGQGPFDAIIDLIQAPGCPSCEHPSAMLKARAAQLCVDPSAAGN
jgi:lipopolysaccharide biosynthesis protein